MEVKIVNDPTKRSKGIRTLCKWIILLGFSFDLNAQLILYVPNPPTYKLKIVPLENFHDSYVIVQIVNKDKNTRDFLYSISLTQSEGRFSSLVSQVNLNLIPYDSIRESKFYSKEFNSVHQTQIKENCRNYFPTSIGKKQYSIVISDAMEGLGTEDNHRYAIWEDYDLSPKKSLYIEIDIEKKKHKASFIDTPRDIFADMCK